MINDEAMEKFRDDVVNHREPTCPNCHIGKIVCPQGKIKQPHFFRCTNDCGWFMNLDYCDINIE